MVREDGWRLILGRVVGSERGDAMEHTRRTNYFDRFDPRARYTNEASSLLQRREVLHQNPDTSRRGRAR